MEWAQSARAERRALCVYLRPKDTWVQRAHADRFHIGVIEHLAREDRRHEPSKLCLLCECGAVDVCETMTDGAQIR